MAAAGRSLKNIRTLSNRVSSSALSYRGYMQITCLEMEKARRNEERRNAARRIAEIDTRLQEIEKEKRELLEAVERRGGPAPSRLPGLEVQRPTPRRSGFRIRY